mgnify:CR=1 FL=1
MNIHKIDLNLLAIFEVVHNEGSMSLAAVRLGKSQSAVSSAINRLRAITDDQLFERQGQRVIATEYADELMTYVTRGLNYLQQGLGEAEGFNYQRENATFRIAGSDYFLCGILHRIFEVIYLTSDNIQIEYERIPDSQTRRQRQVLVERVLDGDIDLIVDHSKYIGLQSEELSRDTWVGLVGRRWKGENSITEELYYSKEVNHIIADTSLSSTLKIQHSEKVLPRLRCDTFSGIPGLVAKTSSMATVPNMIAQVHAKDLGLRCISLPFDENSISTFMLWSKKKDKCDQSIWLRDLILSKSQF